MDQGRVVEDGSPMDLREAGGMFEQMWRKQMGGQADPSPMMPRPVALSTA
jgi:hypothetical protein